MRTRKEKKMIAMKVEILIAAIEVLLCVSEINCHGNEPVRIEK